MSTFPLANLSQYFFGPLIFILSLFMILLILVQRGKGGGLTGALGGPGGQSAFGTKAGDLFTRITIVTAACWIFLLGFAVWWYTESDFSAALAGTQPTMTPSSIGPSTKSDEVLVPTGLGSEAPGGIDASATPQSPAISPSAAEVDTGDLPSKADPEKPAAKEPEKEEAVKVAEPETKIDSTEKNNSANAEPDKTTVNEQESSKPTEPSPSEESTAIPNPEK